MANKPRQKIGRNGKRLIEEVIKWITVITLLFLSYQDFKYRAISWWLLVILAVLPLIESLDVIHFQQMGINGLFLLVQLSLTGFYFKIKGVGFKKLVKEYIGVGDLLFFIVLVIYFSPMNFIVFFNLSLVFSLLFYGIYNAVSKSENILIPLAGLQALCLVLILLLPINRFDDYYLVDWVL